MKRGAEAVSRVRATSGKRKPVIRVELCLVHLSNEGDETYELVFVDADGKWGHELRVGLDGSMEVVNPFERED